MLMNDLWKLAHPLALVLGDRWPHVLSVEEAASKHADALIHERDVHRQDDLPHRGKQGGVDFLASAGRTPRWRVDAESVYFALAGGLQMSLDREDGTVRATRGGDPDREGFAQAQAALEVLAGEADVEEALRWLDEQQAELGGGA